MNKRSALITCTYFHIFYDRTLIKTLANFKAVTHNLFLIFYSTVITNDSCAVDIGHCKFLGKDMSVSYSHKKCKNSSTYPTTLPTKESTVDLSS